MLSLTLRFMVTVVVFEICLKSATILFTIYNCKRAVIYHIMITMICVV